MSIDRVFHPLPTGKPHPCTLCTSTIPAGTPRVADYAWGDFVAVLCFPCARASETLRLVGLPGVTEQKMA